MKKALSFVLILVLALSLCVPVFADNTATDSTPGTITITNALKGETYNLYKLFDFTWDGENAYSYTLPIDSPWETFFTDPNAGGYYFTLELTTRAVSAKTTLGEQDDGTGVKAFANAAMDYIATRIEESKSITPTDTKTPTADGSIVFDGLAYGYYLLDTTVGTVCVLDSNSENLSVTDKTLVPVVDKEVKEDDEESGSEWKEDYATAAVGQTVYFRSIINNVARIEKLVFHDKMSAGLTLNNDDTLKVYMRTIINGPQTYLAKGTDYTVKVAEQGSTLCKEGCTFEIEFDDDYIRQLGTQTAYLVVEYSAELNNQATITDPTAANLDLVNGGNPNEAAVSYGNAQWSNWDKVTVHTWPIKVFKYTGTLENPVPLAGAEFVLAKPLVADNGIKWAYVSALDNNNIPLAGFTTTAEGEQKPNGWIISDVDTKTGIAPVPNGAHKFTSTDDANNLITINGLDSPDDYVLIETKAPEGYNALKEPIKFNINSVTMGEDKVGYVHIQSQQGSHTQINVLNKTGTELPETGGTGTTMFYIVGGVLAVGAVVLLVTKKRMGSES